MLSVRRCLKDTFFYLYSCKARYRDVFDELFLRFIRCVCVFRLKYILRLNNLLNLWHGRKCFLIRFRKKFWHCFDINTKWRVKPNKIWFYILFVVFDISFGRVILDEKVEILFSVDVGICLRMLGGWFESLKIYNISLSGLWWGL